MSGSAVARFECGNCGKRYAWKPQLAGRKVSCKCGQLFVVPSEPPQQDEPPHYELAAEPAPAVAPAASPPHAVSLDYRRKDAPEPEASAYFPDRVKDLYMPLAFIAIGTAVEIGLGFFSRRGGLEGAAAGVIHVGLKLIINTVLMLVAILVVAKIREISFGPVPTAILKLCGISIGPGAIGTLVGLMLAWMPLGGLLGWVVGFVLYFAAIGALFDLDESDTWWCVGTIFFAKVMFVIVAVRILAA